MRRVMHMRITYVCAWQVRCMAFVCLSRQVAWRCALHELPLACRCAPRNERKAQAAGRHMPPAGGATGLACLAAGLAPKWLPVFLHAESGQKTCAL